MIQYRSYPVGFSHSAIAYYILRAKIFEQLAQNSLRQQTVMHKSLLREKEELSANYEKTIDRLRQRLDEKKVIDAVQNRKSS